VNYTTKNEMQVGAATGPLRRFNAAQTVFAVARQYGLTTGVVGWYNPYCGALAPYPNQCYWTCELRTSGRFTHDFWRSFWRPWIRYGSIFHHPTQIFSRSYRAHVFVHLLEPAIDEEINPDNRVHVYQDLMQHAVDTLVPSGPDFVFLHLPLPHAPGFYNRRTQQFDTSGNASYADNLALTDKTLGQLLAILRQSPRWKNTSVVACGDHSWRVYMTKGTDVWTPEDEVASHGGIFDPRPTLMVHLAGQTTPATVSESFPLLEVHDILDDLIRGKQPAFSSISH
jgi:hypothetical protein